MPKLEIHKLHNEGSLQTSDEVCLEPYGICKVIAIVKNTMTLKTLTGKFVRVSGLVSPADAVLFKHKSKEVKV
jgi:hypothetical protein